MKTFGWIVGAILLAAIGYYEGRIFLVDRQVRRLCAIDGGTTVYESVNVPKHYIVDQYGNVEFPDRSPERPYGRAYHYALNATELKIDYPKIVRYEQTFVRNGDHKVLGRKISYSRIGGDMPPSHGTVFSCPEDEVYLTKKIFLPETGTPEVKRQ